MEGAGSTSSSSSSALQQRLETQSCDVKDTDQCAICLCTLIDAETVAKPDSCAHIFCEYCIVEWSKTNPTCPLDRFSLRFELDLRLSFIAFMS